MSLWRNFQRQVRLSEMKSNFVSSVSHELRAPIAAVRLMAESAVGEGSRFALELHMSPQAAKESE